MKRYVFDLGNSNSGPVGFVASVYADSPGAAKDMLFEAIGLEGIELRIDPDLKGGTDENGYPNRAGIDYVQVYFGSGAAFGEPELEEN
jgi:hypothetical protein